MMRILIDTNVLLDVLLSRDPWVTNGASSGVTDKTRYRYYCPSALPDARVSAVAN